MVGAHLDSVPEGPGINDNGSGTATILEIALQMTKLGIEPTQQGALRVLGGRGVRPAGIRVLRREPRRERGARSDSPQPQLRHAGLAQLRALRLRRRRLGDARRPDDAGPRARPRSSRSSSATSPPRTCRPSPPPSTDARTTARSSTADIPAGGLFSGAEDIKTAREQRIYGGTAGEPYDPCYHQPCDDMTNLSIKSLEPDVRRGGARHAHLRATTRRSSSARAPPGRGPPARCTTSTRDRRPSGKTTELSQDLWRGAAS